MRGTLALYFFLASGLAMVMFVAIGLVPTDTAQNIGVLAIAVVLGSGVAAVVARRMSLGFFRYAVLAVTIGGSASLLARELPRLIAGQ